MFEVHGRHSPVFVASEVRKVGEALFKTLNFDRLSFEEDNMAIAPIHQTVRINEINSFVVKSSLLPEKAEKFLNSNLVIQDLKKLDADSFLHHLLTNLKSRLDLDSYLNCGGLAETHLNRAGLNPAQKESKRPLLILDSEKGVSTIPDLWLQQDHVAIWTSLISSSPSTEAEAWFAISPALQIEVALNRFHFFGRFSSIFVGMIRF